MTNVGAVATAVLIHALLRVTIFIEPNYKGCSPLTPISSWIFLLSIVEIICDSQFIPERYNILPRWWLWCVEVFTGVLCMEFGSIIIWCNLEKLIYRVQKILLRAVVPKINDYTGDAIVEGGAITIAACVLYYVSHGTDSVYQWRKRFGRVWKKLKSGGNPSSLKQYQHQQDVTCSGMEDELTLPTKTEARRRTRSRKRTKKYSAR